MGAMVAVGGAALSSYVLGASALLAVGAAGTWFLAGLGILRPGSFPE